MRALKCFENQRAFGAARGPARCNFQRQMMPASRRVVPAERVSEKTFGIDPGAAEGNELYGQVLQLTNIPRPIVGGKRLKFRLTHHQTCTIQVPCVLSQEIFEQDWHVLLALTERRQSQAGTL